jgi:hypothetical protein
MKDHRNTDNMLDAAEQEKIRRGHHEYVAAAGKHGSYVPRKYVHQEYPKMMGKWPKPEYKDFRKQNGVEVPSDVALQQFQNALTEWDAAMSASVVNSRAEEQAWLKENG